MPNYVYIYDENNQYTWDTVILGFDYYNGVYQMVERERLNDDDTVIQERFEDGILRSMSQFDDRGPNPDGVHNWTFIETVYDPIGQVEFRYSQYDDGRIVEENYQNGMLERHFQQDNSEFHVGENLYTWHWVETYYNQSGQIEFKITNFDDDTMKEEYFQNGVLYELREMDVDWFNPDGTMGHHDWHTKQTYFDPNGVIEFRVVDFDDGGRTEDTYFDGVIERSVMMDGYGGPNGNGLHEWSQKEIWYENGTIAFQTTEFDDGVFRECFFFDGMLERIEQYDYSYDPILGSQHAWDRQTTYYDPLGQVQYQYVMNDDGSTVENSYFDGQLERTFQTDSYGVDGNGSETWQSIETFYDPNGDLFSRHYAYDDGSMREDHYIAGVIDYTFYQDGYGGAHAWDRVDIYYDQIGQIDFRSTFNDDGTIKEDQYFQGSISESRTFDNAHVHTWEEQAFLFQPGGTLEVKGNRWDDGDVDATIYNFDGSRELREVDYAGDDAWGARTTHYDAQGAIVWVEEYADIGETPPDYIPPDLFGYYYV